MHSLGFFLFLIACIPETDTGTLDSVMHAILESQKRNDKMFSDEATFQMMENALFLEMSHWKSIFDMSTSQRNLFSQSIYQLSHYAPLVKIGEFEPSRFEMERAVIGITRLHFLPFVRESKTRILESYDRISKIRGAYPVKPELNRGEAVQHLDWFGKSVIPLFKLSKQRLLARFSTKDLNHIKAIDDTPEVIMNLFEIVITTLESSQELLRTDLLPAYVNHYTFLKEVEQLISPMNAFYAQLAAPQESESESLVRKNTRLFFENLKRVISKLSDQIEKSPRYKIQGLQSPKIILDLKKLAEQMNNDLTTSLSLRFSK